MDELSYFIKGIVMGFSIAAPVGPIGMLCIKRTLTNGMLYGFISGAGAATADGIYGILAAFGIASVAVVLHEYRFVLHIAGGLLLLCIGWNIYKSQAVEKCAKADTQGLISAYTTTFALTITNPMTIMSFAAIFAGMGVGADTGIYLAAGILVAGVFSGSLLWWLVLSSLVGLLCAGLSSQRMIWINKLSGLMIIGFGLASIFS